jgi:beta-glucosidase
MKQFHQAGSFVAVAAIVTTLFPAAPRAAAPPVTNKVEISDEAIRTRADALIAQMTPQEKAGQLSLYFYLAQMPQMLKCANEALARGELGALLFVSDPAEANRLQKVAVEKTRLKIPLLFGYDVIHGLHTIFPMPLAMTASWDPNMVEEVQSIAAREARAVGVHWVFAPNVDIARDPRWGRMVEGVGEDPYLGAAMAAAQVRGFQGASIGTPGRVIAGPKHFAGYGASLGGRDYDEVNLSDNELWNVYLPPFKAAVDAGAGNIMTAYMTLNGVPATGNRWLLSKVLREAWGFKGFVVSDSNAVGGLTRHGLSVDAQDAAVRALKAGVNIELAAPGRPPAVRSLPAAVAAGKISETEIDDAVRGVLTAKIRMGLFECRAR